MELIFVVYLSAFFCVALFTFRFANRRIEASIHLPTEIKDRTTGMAPTFTDQGIKGILTIPAYFVDRALQKVQIFPRAGLDKLKMKLITAGRPMTVSQFIALRMITILAFPFVVSTVIVKPPPSYFMVAFAAGFIFPDFWLDKKIKKRQMQILKDLPHIIELMNICVCSGLDFMVAVTRVTKEFRPCPLVSELNIMIRELQMGSSRRDALKNFAQRINTSEISTFVLTLLQTDRMGTPIGKILKSQSSEIRIRRFQRGEEMALKAPIKLLFPLLFFIMPVVMVIVAGPILIQFLFGSFLKF